MEAQIQQLILDLTTRVEGLTDQVTQRAQEHQVLHPLVSSHQAMLTELNGRVAQLESVSSQAASGGGNNDAWRRRLDRLAEGKETGTKYDGQAKGQGFREWAFDLKDTFEQYDSRLSLAMDEVESDQTPVDVHRLNRLSVGSEEDKTMRRVIAKHTNGLAKTFVRTRADLGGLELWRQLAQYFDPMTDARAMADGGQLTQPAVAKDWETLGRQICAWEAQCRQYEARTDPSQHLPEAFKMQAVWHMVPEKEKGLLYSVRRQCTTVVQLKKQLLELVQERQPGQAPMLIGNVAQEEERNDEPTDGDERELVDPESGDLALYKFEAVSGRWSRSTTRGRKPDKGKGKGKGDDKKACFRCGRTGYFKSDCISKTHKEGYTLKMPLRNIEEEGEATEDVSMGSIQLCAVEPVPTADPLWTSDAWSTFRRKTPTVYNVHATPFRPCEVFSMTCRECEALGVHSGEDDKAPWQTVGGNKSARVAVSQKGGKTVGNSSGIYSRTQYNFHVLGEKSN